MTCLMYLTILQSFNLIDKNIKFPVKTDTAVTLKFQGHWKCNEQVNLNV